MSWLKLTKFSKLAESVQVQKGEGLRQTVKFEQNQLSKDLNIQDTLRDTLRSSKS